MTEKSSAYFSHHEAKLIHFINSDDLFAKQLAEMLENGNAALQPKPNSV